MEHLVEITVFFGINFSDPAGFRFNYPKNQLSFELQIHRK